MTRRSNGFAALAFGICVLAFSVAGCAGADDSENEATREDPIVGGALDSVHTYEGFLVNPPDAPGCSGTLIGPHKVVTAAHCFDDPPKHLHFGLKSHWTEAEPGKLYRAERYARHPRYHAGAEHGDRWDIALVILEEPVPLSVTKPALLGDIPDDPDGVLYVASGYGRHSPDGKPAVYHSRRRLLIEHYHWADHFGIQTSSPGGSTCSGDSGGGLFIKSTRKLVGVDNLGFGGSDGFCHDGDVTQFGRIDAHRQFLTCAAVDDAAARVDCYKKNGVSP